MKRRGVGLLCAVAVLLVVASLPAGAQVSDGQHPAQVPTPVPTDLVPPTSSPPPSEEPQDPPPAEAPQEESSQGQPQPGGGGQFTAPAAGTADVFPLAIPNIPRSASMTTGRLIQILAPLAERGMPLEEALVMASGPFPVAGQAVFSHDYGFPRYTPYPHLHEGTDIFAAAGTPIVASAPGVVAGFGDGAVGGLSVWLSGDDAHGYYYTHLLGFAPGLHQGQRVDVGTVIGYVGNTGNAISTPAHLHFEIHPPIVDRKGKIIAGGAQSLPNGMAYISTPPADPKPYLDAWLGQAEQKAQALVVELVRRYALVSRHVHFSRKVDDIFPAPTTDQSGEMVWLALMQPELAALGISKEILSERSAGFAVTEYGRRREAVKLAVQSYYQRLATFTRSTSYGLAGPAQ